MNAVAPLLAAPADPFDVAARHGIGTVDQVNAACISGWAWDPQCPDASILVDILDGDVLLATVRADLPRPDLQALGMGNGRHGFALSLGPGVLPMAEHLVHVRRHEDGAELHQSPWRLQRDDAAFDDSARERLAKWIGAECAWARRATDLEAPLGLLARLLGEVVARHAELRSKAASDTSVDLAALADTVAPSQWVAAAGRALSQAYPAPALSPASQPRVSIVIPVFNQFALTHACLQSIAEHAPEVAFEVIVVDDASTDETLLAPLLWGHGARVVRQDVNQGFVHACNRGAAAARGEFICFLNNDTLVQPGWLDELAGSFDTDPRIGVAGAKLLNANGTLQECGGLVWRLADAWNWGRGEDPQAPAHGHLREVDYVSGAALMIRTALFRELGGFDTLFAPAYYEDTDLCFRVRQSGRRVVVQPLSRVLHLEGQTHGTSTSGPGLKRHQVLNRRKFAERWRDTLAAHRLNGDAPALEAARHVQRHAVFIDDTLPTPDEDAGSQAALQHMRSLMRLGYQVSFVPAHDMARRTPHVERLQRIGVECIYQPYFGSVEEYLRRRQAPLDLVYLHRVGNASPYLGLVRRLHPAARVAFNVADLHHLRLARQAELSGDAALAATARRLREEELGAVRGADVTLVHSQAERELLVEAVADARVAVVPWSYAPRRLVSPVPRQGVVFVGGYRHAPNVDAALWLVREVMPRVWQRLPELGCTLVGSHMPPEVQALAAPRVEAAGHVADLAPVYARRLVAVAPLRYGAGIKGKVLEALACGLPCVMTGIAAEGLPLDRILGSLVASDADGLAALIVALHEDPDWHESAVEAGLDLIRRHYSDVALDSALKAALALALPQAPAGAICPTATPARPADPGGSPPLRSAGPAEPPRP